MQTTTTVARGKNPIYDWIIILVSHLFCGSLFGILWNKSLAKIGLPSLSWTQSICFWSMIMLVFVAVFTVCYSIYKINQELAAIAQNKALDKLLTATSATLRNSNQQQQTPSLPSDSADAEK